MLEVNDFYRGQKVTLSSNRHELREDIREDSGKTAVVVDFLDNVVLIQLDGDEEGAFMVLKDELVPPMDKKWTIGQVVEFTYEGEEKIGEIATPYLVLNGVIHYGIEVDGGHVIVPVSSFSA